ncbi:hypothetical protein ACFE04_009338 [Oxalis oulophora]
MALRKGNNEVPTDKLSEARYRPPAQKVWAGHIGLSSSVNASVVAYFKSGEKMPDDTEWSEEVEVIGKVKIDDFEKFIRDFSSSRSRGMMVTSLYWNKGSSRCGLAGMKMVADDYKKDKKVGFVRISEGTQLYICPRTDAIITILAKYGFFKGLFAIEENKDSLIGCVVWRRSASVVTQKPESILRELSPNCCSDMTMQRVDQMDLSCKKEANESVPDGVEKDGSTPDFASRDEQPNFQNSIASSVLTISTTPKDSIFVGNFSEAPPTQKSGIENTKPMTGSNKSEDENVEKFFVQLNSQDSSSSRDSLQISSALTQSSITTPKNASTEKLRTKKPERSPEIQNPTLLLSPVTADNQGTVQLRGKLKLQNSSTNSVSLQTPSVMTNTTPTASLENRGSMGRFAEDDTAKSMEIEKPKPSPEIHIPVLPPSAVIAKKMGIEKPASSKNAGPVEELSKVLPTEILVIEEPKPSPEIHIPALPPSPVIAKKKGIKKPASSKNAGPVEQLSKDLPTEILVIEEPKPSPEIHIPALPPSPVIANKIGIEKPASPKNAGPVEQLSKVLPTENLVIEEPKPSPEIYIPALPPSPVIAKKIEIEKPASPKNAGPMEQLSKVLPTENLVIEEPKPSPEIYIPALPPSPVIAKEMGIENPASPKNAGPKEQLSKDIPTENLVIEEPKQSPSIQNPTLPQSPNVAKDQVSGQYNDHHKLQNSSTSSDFEQKPSVLTKSTSMTRSSEAPPTQMSGTEKPKPISGIQNIVFPPSQAVAENLLPTQDMGQAHNKSRPVSNNPENIYSTLPSSAMSLDSKPTLNKRKHEKTVPRSFSNDALVKLPRLTEIGNHHTVAASPSLVDHIAQSKSLIRFFGDALGSPYENPFDTNVHVRGPPPNPQPHGNSQSGVANLGPNVGKPAPFPPNPTLQWIQQSGAASGPISQNCFVGDNPVWVPQAPVPRGISQSSPATFIPSQQRPISAVGNLYPGHPSHLPAYQHANFPLSESHFHGHQQTLHGISQSAPATFIHSSMPQQPPSIAPFQTFPPQSLHYMGQNPRNFGVTPTQQRPGNEFGQSVPSNGMMFHADNHGMPTQLRPGNGFVQPMPSYEMMFYANTPVNPTQQRTSNEFVPSTPSNGMMFHANTHVPPPPTQSYGVGPPRNPYGSWPSWPNQ